MKSYRPLSIYVTDTVAGTVVVGRKALIQNFRPYIVSKPNKYKQISQSTSRHQEWTTKADRKVLVDYSKRYALRKLITHLTVSRSP